MFIKVHTTDKVIMINISEIQLMYEDKATGLTNVVLGTDQLLIKETPEDIDNLIEEAHKQNLYRGFRK